MNPSSTSYIHFEQVFLGGVLMLMLGCPGGSAAESEVDTNNADADGPWSPCGDITMTQWHPADSNAIVLHGWTVAEVLARIIEVEVGLEWTYWDSAYFVAPQPEPQTLLQLRPILSSAVIRGYAGEIEDEFCKDRIAVEIDIEVSSGDGVLVGTSSAELTLWIAEERTSLYLSANADDLGFETTWPLDEERQPPSEVVLRIESESPGLGLIDTAIGDVWLHWVWVIDNDGGVPERWEEYFTIAALG